MLQSPTGPSWMRVSQLEVLITRACEPSLHEPNYALHLEVAEYINKKKANSPREAAMCIARLANHRNPHIAILALALLDTLVQSCGYPFHLQISTKEFLNELVRRFPERPPPFPGPVMSRILELINGWKEGICSDSRWKEDLGNIRDMHRLLTFKGYRFRDIPRSTNTAAAATANLKTAEELEEEDRSAQSAKLQELIRRGTPRDLAAAQELMKSLAGANPDAKPDYRSQALTELNKLEQKVILLNEMLDNVDTTKGEKFVSGDVYDQVSSILTAARPKLQKWISDAETEDPESLDTFLQINDQINNVITRYEGFKKGDYSITNIPQELAGSSTSGGSGDLSLIDFDDNSGGTSSAAAPSNGNPVNDLSGLFSPNPPPVQQQQPSFGGFSMGGMQHQPAFGVGIQQQIPFQQQQQQQQPQPFAPAPVFANGGFQGPLPQPIHGATPPAAIMLPGTPSSQRSTPVPAAMGASPPNYFGKAPLATGPVGTAGMGMGMGNLGMGMQQPSYGSNNNLFGGSPQPVGGMQMGGYAPSPPQQQPQPHAQQGFAFGTQMQPTQAQPQAQPQVPQAPAPTSTQSKDPFADLAGLF